MNSIILDAIVLVFGSKTAIGVVTTVAISVSLIATVIHAWKFFDRGHFS